MKQSQPQRKPLAYWIYFLTCTEPENVPEQNCVDLAAAACWIKWKWKDAPVGASVRWVPADTGGNDI